MPSDFDLVTMMGRAKAGGWADEVWQHRYRNLYREYELMACTLHELRNSHHVSIERPSIEDELAFKCRDCGWKPRKDPYATD